MENLLTATNNNTAPNKAPDAVPEKFRDKENGTVRVDALLKSYLELEKKLARHGTIDPSKLDAGQLRHALGVPETPDDYAIDINHTLFTQDPEIDQRLHARNFSNDQAQLVYDLAAEKMMPMILDVARDFEAERQMDRLVETFGGKDRYAEVARQLLAYGRKNLPADVVDGLSTTYEGIMALYRMMQSGKPLGVQQPVEQPAMDESALRSMMRDPKYWREKDPSFIKKVSDGFRQVFAEAPKE